MHLFADRAQWFPLIPSQVTKYSIFFICLNPFLLHGQSGRWKRQNICDWEPLFLSLTFNFNECFSYSCFTEPILLNQILRINSHLFLSVHVTLLPSYFRYDVLKPRKPGNCLLLFTFSSLQDWLNLPKTPTDQITFFLKPGTLGALQLANIWVSTVCRFSSRP